jgi:16S rRNA processing protein RimM
MTSATRVLLGRIATAHGIRGEVVIDSYAADPGDIGAYGPLMTDEGREIAIASVRVTPKGVIARLAGVSDRNAAEALRGTRLYTTRDRLPDAAEGEFYHTDLIGLRADGADGSRLGIVSGVHNYGAGDLLEVKLEGKRDSELIPFTDAFVPVVDIAGGRVVVELPPAAEDDGEEGEPS